MSPGWRCIPANQAEKSDQVEALRVISPLKELFQDQIYKFLLLDISRILVLKFEGLSYCHTARNPVGKMLDVSAAGLL